MQLENLKLKIIELPDETFFTLRKWVRKEESDRRYNLISKQKKQDHIKKIKKFRKGHKLIVTRDIYSSRTMVSIPAGTIVKLLNTKGQRTRAEIYYEKTDEEWLIEFQNLEDAQDPEILSRVKSDIGTHKRLQSIFQS